MAMQASFVSVIKRSGEKAPYNLKKIELVLQKAFKSSSDDILEREISQLAKEVELSLITMPKAHKTVHIEKIQDSIERILMKNEYYDTAKKFIIYRQKHAEQRLLKTINKQEKIHGFSIVKRNNTTVPFNLNKILVTLRNASFDINTHQAPLDPIVMELEKNIFENIHTHDIEEALILSTTSFIEKDPGYDKIATRLLKQKLYREVFNEKITSQEKFTRALTKKYRTQFVENIKFGVEKDYFTKEFLNFDLETLSNELILENDSHLEYLGMRTLYERYFVKDNGRCIETPQAFWMRVAMGLSINEQDRIARPIEFYKLISELRYVPSTPTLFHAGLSHPQLSSCYLSTVSDDLHNIFKCIGDNAQMAKWSGGIGNDWTPIRATNTLINSTNVESQGVVPFLKIANDTTLAINRSGKRRGATCAYLETWHLDIEDFIDLRRNTGDDRRRTHDMNIAVWVPDLFMKRVDQNGDWVLFSPNHVPDLHETYGADFEQRYIKYEKLAKEGSIPNFKIIPAIKLWRKILTRLFETGHPWITFKDPCNIRSPQDHVGVIHNSNLCTEITLNNSQEETAVCNLGSINLNKHVSEDGLNQYQLTDTIKTAMRMLDNVIDINFYPTIEGKTSNQKHRPVGLGLMGLQDALYKLKLPFTGEATLNFMDETMEFISYHAILASSELAKERGHYPSFKGSKWDRGMLPFDTIALLEKERGEEIPVNRNSIMDWNAVREHIQVHGMRNSNTMAIAPTATISNIAGCFPCIEPIYKNIYVKANMSGEFTVINKYLLKDLKAQGLWSSKMLEKIKYYDGSIATIDEIPENLKALYKEAFEIDSIDLIKLTAIRAKWIDQSQSHNVFIKGATGKKLHDIYMYAWKMGLKTTYYLRTMAATQIEKSTLDAKEYGYTQKRDYKQLSDKAQSNTTPPLQTADNIDNTHEKNNAMEENMVTTTAQSEGGTVLTMAQSNVTKTISQETTQRNTTTTQNDTTILKNTQQEDFPLDHTNATSLVESACSILDPDCEACQ